MAYKVKDIIDEVLALPANSRAYVAEVLLESLDFEEGAPVLMTPGVRRSRSVVERSIPVKYN